MSAQGSSIAYCRDRGTESNDGGTSFLPAPLTTTSYLKNCAVFVLLTAVDGGQGKVCVALKPKRACLLCNIDTLPYVYKSSHLCPVYVTF